MGPYCKFCDNRCFTYFPDNTPEYILAAYKTNTIVATCRGGQDFEMGRIGYSYDRIMKHIEIVVTHTCAVCHGSLDTPDAPIAENDGYGKTVYVHPNCHPDNPREPKKLSDKQRERQGKEHRSTNGKYAKVNPCNRCGRSAGIDYFSDARTDTNVNDFEVGDAALCLCNPCATYMADLSDADFIAEISSPSYGELPQGKNKRTNNSPAQANK